MESLPAGENPIERAEKKKQKCQISTNIKEYKHKPSILGMLAEFHPLNALHASHMGLA